MARPRRTRYKALHVKGINMRFLVSAAAIVFLAPATAHAEDLPQAVAEAYRNNPTLEGARLSARAAYEGANQNRASYLPQVEVSGSAGVRSVQSESNGFTSPRQDLDPNAVGVQISQSLYSGGRRGAQGRIARGQIDAAQERLRAAEQSVLLGVVTAYVDVRRDAEQVTIRANNVDVLARQLQAARDRFEVGEITRTDVAQAEARLAGAQSGLAAAQAQLEVSRANYREIVGTQPGELTAPPAPPELPADLETALQFALTANPQILAAEQSAAIAEAQVRVEAAGLRPQVSVVGAASRSREASVANFTQESASASAQITVPLYQGGYARSRVRQARLNAERAGADLEAARRAVIGDVTGAWSSVLASRRVIEASQQQVRANTLAFEGVEQEQQVGLRTTLDVLDAEQELLDARLNLVRAERDAYVAAHQLLVAIGALDASALGVNEALARGDESDADGRNRWLPWSRAD